MSTLLILAFLLVLSPCSAETARVARVVDGDTVVLEDGRRVRYIGVNTPELNHPQRGEEPGARAATEQNERLVAGREVRLERDVQQFDRYGRTLAYIYVGQTMVNAEMVRRGYAQVMTIPPNVKHQERLVRLEREARQARRGLWAGPGFGVAPGERRDGVLAGIRGFISRVLDNRWLWLALLIGLVLLWAVWLAARRHRPPDDPDDWQSIAADVGRAERTLRKGMG